MKLILILSLVCFARGESCEGIHVRGKFHRKEVLAKGLDRPYQLSFAKHEHKIFFSVNVGKEAEDTFKIAYIEKNHTGHKFIDEIENGFATTIDRHSDTAYFGGSKGIYKLHLTKEHKIEEIVKHLNIWDLFFKHELYFITYPSQHLYKLNVTSRHSPERQENIHEEIYQFAIDSDEDIFITNKTGLYEIKKDEHHRIFYNGATTFRAVETNNKGEAHFCGKHAIYVADKKKHELIEIAHIKNIFGLTFDTDDNIIYSDAHEIVKLLPEDCK